MTRHRLSAHRACPLSTIALASALAAVLVCVPHAQAQDRSPGFLDNLFSRGQQRQQPQQQDQDQDQPAQPAPRVAQQGGGGGGDDASRIDRIENALRQLTGTIEQLQHDSQMLQMQLKRLQDDTEYRFQQLGGRGGGAPMAAPGGAAPAPMPPGGASPPVNNGRRSDVFDPNQNPNAVGTPRMLGNASVVAPAQNNPPIMNNPPVGAQAGTQVGAQIGAQIGAPGGREAGAPLNLNAPDSQEPPDSVPPGTPQTAAIPAPQGRQLPPVMAPRNNGGQGGQGTQLATLPPSATPKDEYELAYGYVLRKDYALATQAFGDFLRKYPSDKLVPEAQYWLGESLFQQQRYPEAGENFLAVSTKYERSSKAPDALLRLGQSLAAMHKKEASCATLAEVDRKFPRASASVKRSVAQEQKRVHC